MKYIKLKKNKSHIYPLYILTQGYKCIKRLFDLFELKFFFTSFTLSDEIHFFNAYNFLYMLT